MTKLNKIRSAFNKVKEDWFKDLPLVDLRGLDEAKKRELILNAIRSCIEKVPLVITEETEEESESRHSFMSTHQDGNESAIVITTYYPETSFVGVKIFYRMIPVNRRQEIYEMVNLLNARSSVWRFFISPDIGQIVLESGMFITQYFNPQELFLLIRYMLHAGYTNLPHIEELLTTGQSPVAILENHDDKMRDFIKINPGLFKNQS
jgi:hypothetical protein